jgi:hypothetical protein
VVEITVGGEIELTPGDEVETIPSGEVLTPVSEVVTAPGSEFEITPGGEVEIENFQTVVVGKPAEVVPSGDDAVNYIVVDITAEMDLSPS